MRAEPSKEWNCTEAESLGAKPRRPEAAGAAHSEGITGADAAQPTENPAAQHENQERPLITFALLAYNHERFVREAVEGAFSQTYSPLEIILSDDCSSDRTFEVMQKMAAAYVGPHRIVLNRNAQNLGIGPHVNRIVDLSDGQLIVGAAGDDISLPHRTERVYESWITSGGKACSIYSAFLDIDEAGKCGGRRGQPPPPNWRNLEKITARHVWISGCSHAWQKRVFEVFGPLNSNVMAEDACIGFRACALGGVQFIDEPLVKYRSHGGSTSRYLDDVFDPDKMKARYARHWMMTASIFEQYLTDLRNPVFQGSYSKSEIDAARFVAASELTDCLRQARFIVGNRNERLKLIRSGVQSRVPITKLLWWTAKTLVPGVEQWHLRQISGH